MKSGSDFKQGAEAVLYPGRGKCRCGKFVQNGKEDNISAQTEAVFKAAYDTGVQRHRF